VHRRHPPAPGRDIDDPPGAAVVHRRKECARHSLHAETVDVHRLGEDRLRDVRRVVRVVSQQDASVVDKDVNRSHAFGRDGDRLLTLYVERDSAHRGGIGEARGGGLPALEIAAASPDLHAAFGKLAAYLEAEPAISLR